jgi:hypothetical protein
MQLFDLPPELLTLILDLLNRTDLLSFRLVSKRGDYAARDLFLWRSLCKPIVVRFAETSTDFLPRALFGYSASIQISEISPQIKRLQVLMWMRLSGYPRFLNRKGLLLHPLNRILEDCLARENDEQAAQKLVDIKSNSSAVQRIIFCEGNRTIYRSVIQSAHAGKLLAKIIMESDVITGILVLKNPELYNAFLLSVMKSWVTEFDCIRKLFEKLDDRRLFMQYFIENWSPLEAVDEKSCRNIGILLLTMLTSSYNQAVYSFIAEVTTFPKESHISVIFSECRPQSLFSKVLNIDQETAYSEYQWLLEVGELYVEVMKRDSWYLRCMQWLRLFKAYKDDTIQDKQKWLKGFVQECGIEIMADWSFDGLTFDMSYRCVETQLYHRELTVALEVASRKIAEPQSMLQCNQLTF